MSKKTPLNRTIQQIRSFLFWPVAFIITFFYLILLNFLIILPYKPRYRIMRSWNYLILGWLRLCCGLSFEVTGKENIPDHPVVVMSKHQSAFETVALTIILPPMSWVLKKELLYIPVFGWALFMMNPIAINRKSGRKAVSQIIEQGKKRLAENISVMIFPEGTRVKPGHKERFKRGGFILAEKANADILPIAHNAGEFWPKNSTVIWPGKVSISIGPLIKNNKLDSEQLLKQTENWIEKESKRLHLPKRFSS